MELRVSPARHGSGHMHATSREMRNRVRSGPGAHSGLGCATGWQSVHSARREHDGHEGMLAACERNAPLNAALFMLLHGEHDKRIRAVLLSLESVLLWLTEVWVGGWGVWVVGWGEASYFVWWVGGWVAAPEGRMVVRWEGGFCVLKKLHADQKWVVRKRTERWTRHELVSCGSYRAPADDESASSRRWNRH